MTDRGLIDSSAKMIAVIREIGIVPLWVKCRGTVPASLQAEEVFAQRKSLSVKPFPR